MEYWSDGRQKVLGVRFQVSGQREVSGVGFQPALVRYDRFLLFTARDPCNILSSKIIEI